MRMTKWRNNETNYRLPKKEKLIVYYIFYREEISSQGFRFRVLVIDN